MWARTSRLPEVCDMCGICGTVAVSGLADAEAARLRVQAMLRSLSHRGPDAVGHVVSESAVLGVTRLAIRGVRTPISRSWIRRVELWRSATAR